MTPIEVSRMGKIKKEYICEKGDKSALVIEDITIEIKPDATLILGFAGVGLIGNIICNALIDQIEDMTQIGFITSEYLPPISVFYQGVLKHPFRLFYTEKYNLIIGICEVPFQIPSAYNDLARTICNWALSEDVNAKDILVFQGMLQQGLVDEFPVFYASEQAKNGFYEDNDVKKLERGIISGPESTILNEALTNKLHPTALFTPVSQIPTPEAAAAIIKILNKQFDLNIEIKELLEEGKELKQKMMDLAQKAKEYQQKQLTQSPGDEYTGYYQ